MIARRCAARYFQRVMPALAILADGLTSLAAAAAQLTLWPVLAALPWITMPFIMIARLQGSRTLDGESPDPPPGAPLLSVIIPARNEARNIARCINSVLGSSYRAIEVIVVDDHSEDDTGIIAREIAERDKRVRVIEAMSLPEGWFGKQWACENGAMAASGSILLFADADTMMGAELYARAVNAMRARNLAFLSVFGRQEMRSFWERVVQPHLFAMITMRFGGTGTVNNSPRVQDKIANGQCIFMTRAAYEKVGGHASVRYKPAEDLALAQRAFSLGLNTEMIIGVDQLATRMYTSLREIVDGWTKNIWTAAPDQMPGGKLGVMLIPVLLPIPPLMATLPPLVLLAQFVLPVGPNIVAWALLCTGVMLVFWALVYAAIAGYSPLYAFTFPLGAGVVLYIILRAMSRGRRVVWKGRGYVTE
jgi:hypothetical protein